MGRERGRDTSVLDADFEGTSATRRWSKGLNCSTKTPAVDPALSRTVLILLHWLRCWDGHCWTCRRSGDLERLVLLPGREQQATSSAFKEQARGLELRAIA